MERLHVARSLRVLAAMRLVLDWPHLDPDEAADEWQVREEEVLHRIDVEMGWIPEELAS